MIGAILAAVGIGTSIVGSIGASSAAKKKAGAEKQNAKKQAKLTKKANKVYAKQADNQAKAAKEAANIVKASTAEVNARMKEMVAEINALRGEQVAAQNQQVDASVAAEDARQAQMFLQSRRDQRSTIRNALLARSLALAGATASGAEGGSGLQGGFAQIAAQRNMLLTGIFQNTDIGNAIFAANKQYAIAGGLANEIGAEIDSAKSLGEADISAELANRQVELAQSGAKYADKNASLVKDLYKVDTKKAKAQSQANITSSSAQSSAATYQGISNIGSSLTSAGFSLMR